MLNGSHPDDPPICLFGVKNLSNSNDYKYILDPYKSSSNGMTFCAGSLASNKKNDAYKFSINLKK